MKLVSSAIRLTGALSCRTRFPWTVRSIFADSSLGNGMNDDNVDKSSEFSDDFMQRIFHGSRDGNSKNSLLFDKFDRLGMGRGWPTGGSRDVGGAYGQFNEVPGESFNTLSDGMDAKLKKAATTFVTSDEIAEDDYSFRPDVKFRPGMTYTLRDLDLTKPAAQKPFRRPEFETTTEEVLRKADFRIATCLVLRGPVARGRRMMIPSSCLHSGLALFLMTMPSMLIATLVLLPGVRWMTIPPRKEKLRFRGSLRKAENIDISETKVIQGNHPKY